MLHFYNFYLRKGLLSKSTLIITILSISMLFWLNGYLPYYVAQTVKDSNLSNQSSIFQNAEFISGKVIAYSLSMGSFVLLVSLFAGFKGATLFRSEIEDSSILVMISKPINKFRFNLVRWMVFMTIMFLFVFTLSISQAFGMMLGSKFVELSALDIFLGTTITTALGMVIALIFSSIALILSTFLSSALTIGLTALIGLISPITSIIQPLTTSETQIAVGKSMDKLLGMNSSFYKQLEDVNVESFDEINKDDIFISNAELSTLYYLNNKEYNLITTPENVSLTKRVQITDIISEDNFKEILSEKDVEKRKNKVEIFKNTRAFHTLKAKTNPYTYLKFLDISYHSSLLSSIIADVAVSDEQMSKFYQYFNVQSASNGSGNLGPIRKNRKVVEDSNFIFSSSFIGNDNKISSIIQDENGQSLYSLQLYLLTTIADFISKQEEEKGAKISEGDFYLADIESLKDFLNENKEFSSEIIPANLNIEQWLKSKDVYDYYEFLGGKEFSNLREKLIKENSNFTQSLQLVVTNDPNTDKLYTKYESTDYLNKYWVLAFYITFSLLLTFISFYKLNRLNIR